MNMSNLQLLFDAHVNSNAFFHTTDLQDLNFVENYLMTNHCYFEQIICCQRPCLNVDLLWLSMRT